MSCYVDGVVRRSIRHEFHYLGKYHYDMIAEGYTMLRLKAEQVQPGDHNIFGSICIDKQYKEDNGGFYVLTFDFNGTPVQWLYGKDSPVNVYRKI